MVFETKSDAKILGKAIETAANPIAISNLEGEIIYVNQAFLDAWGYTDKNEILGKLATEFWMNPDQAAEVMSAIQTSGHWSGEMVASTKKGNQVPFRLTASLIFDDGQPIGMRGSFVDISVQKEALSKLKNSEVKFKQLKNEFEMILDHLPALIFYKDDKNNFLRVNKYIADAHNVTKEELEGKSLFDIYPEEDAQAYLKDDLQVIKSGKPKLFKEEQWETEEGLKWVRTSKMPVENEDGEVVGIVGISTDITDLKAAQAKIEHLNSLLMAIRNINQHIVQESDFRKMLDKACESLVEAMGYLGCSIGFLDNTGEKIEPVAQAGKCQLEKDWSITPKGKGNAPDCVKTAVSSGELHLLNSQEDCKQCDFRAQYENKGCLTIVAPIIGRNSTIGFLQTFIEKQGLIDQREKNLFLEIADDLAFAWSKNKAELEKRVAQQELQELNLELESRIETKTEELAEANYYLLERVKEQRCLYRVSRIVRNYIKPIDDILSDLIKPIEEGWQYPDITKVRIRFGDKISASEGFRETDKMLQSQANTSNGDSIEVSVSYAEEKPEKDIGPFFQEEEILLDEIVEQIADALSRREAEIALRESEKLQRIAIEEAAIGMVMVNPNGKFTRVNNSFCKIVGYSENELLAMSYQDVTHPDDHKIGAEVVKDLLKGKKKRAAFEKRYIRKDGQVIFVRLTTTLLRDEDNNPIGFFTQIEDITERIHAEQKLQRLNEKLEEKVEERTRELQESRELYRTVLETMPDAVTVTNPEMEIVMTNQMALDMHGFDSLDEMEGMNAVDLIAPEEHQKALENAKIAMQKGTLRNLEYELLRHDGSRFPALMNVSVIRDEENNPAQFIAVTRDITERKRLQEKVIRNERLAALGQLSGGIGHELRNPLGAIKNSVYFLRMVVDSSDNEIRETLDILDKEVQNAVDIIDSLLNFARPKSPSRQSIEIVNLIDELLKDMEIPNNIEIIKKFEHNIPSVLVDPVQMERVFQNLIANAIDAIPDEGSIKVSAECSSSKKVAVSIADNGCGIPEEDLERIFEPLYTTKAKGIGLGLAITKSIIEAHDGRIEVRSQEDKGTEFTVYLPYPQGK